MTRVTPLPRDLAKLTRSLGSTVAAPCNSQRLNSGSRALAAKLRLRKDLENGIAEVPASEVRKAPNRPHPRPSLFPFNCPKQQPFGLRVTPPPQFLRAFPHRERTSIEPPLPFGRPFSSRPHPTYLPCLRACLPV